MTAERHYPMYEVQGNLDVTQALLVEAIVSRVPNATRNHSVNTSHVSSISTPSGRAVVLSRSYGFVKVTLTSLVPVPDIFGPTIIHVRNTYQTPAVAYECAQWLNGA